MKDVVIVIVSTILSHKFSMIEALQCFQCSKFSGNIKCPLSGDSKEDSKTNTRKYIEAGDSSSYMCMVQIDYNNEVVLQGVMSKADCQDSNKKILILSRVKNVVCCSNCDGCNWNWDHATTNNSCGITGGGTEESKNLSLSNVDFKTASLVMFIFIIILLLVGIGFCIYCLCNLRCCNGGQNEHENKNSAKVNNLPEDFQRRPEENYNNNNHSHFGSYVHQNSPPVSHNDTVETNVSQELNTISEE